MGGKKEETSPGKEQRRPLSIIVETDDDSSEDEKFVVKDKPKILEIHKLPTIEITECLTTPELNNNDQKSGQGQGQYSDAEDDIDNDLLKDTDLQLLKQVTTRLKLSTRRQSYTVWKSQFIDRSPKLGKSKRPSLSLDNTDNKLTNERKQRIDDALEWLRKELHEMRIQDQELARQFLSLKQDIQQLKLIKSCEEHQDMLDDVQCELEELDDLPDVLDLPAYGLSDNPLKHLGVTRMNIHSRRFSTC